VLPLPPSLVVCLRHGEKPANAEKRWKPLDDSGPGLDAHGRRSRHSLTVRGWQRAGALAGTGLCGHLLEPDHSNPVVMFAPDYGAKSHKRRPYQTILPLSRRLGLEITLPCKKDDVDTLHAEVTKVDGVAVVCWEHEFLAKLARKLVDQAEEIEWPDDRFDVLWLIRVSATGAEGSCEKQDQRLLPGDHGSP
jgi:hypothetical protein